MAGLITPPLYGRSKKAVLRRKIALLVAAALMLASSGMASAAPCDPTICPTNGGGPYTGALNASPSAAFGIATAKYNVAIHQP